MLYISNMFWNHAWWSQWRALCTKSVVVHIHADKLTFEIFVDNAIIITL